MARVAAYPSEGTKERWQDEAQQMGMSDSNWVQAMVEAGRKKFTRDVEPDQSRKELRQKQNDLRKELRRARDRIEELEEQVHVSEREAVLNYLDSHPGAEYRDLVQHVSNTANARIARLLDQMEGTEVDIDEQQRIYKR
jgi:hypothetical protein